MLRTPLERRKAAKIYFDLYPDCTEEELNRYCKIPLSTAKKILKRWKQGDFTNLEWQSTHPHQKSLIPEANMDEFLTTAFFNKNYGYKDMRHIKKCYEEFYGHELNFSNDYLRHLINASLKRIGYVKRFNSLTKRYYFESEKELRTTST
ncbi:hypothetical protein BKE30_15070 [Alkanindiges hydrocarboniclasticus]|uniref:Uncharacterized protein n=2 Tax=Alkanindiges hydrocarboniclasticus TaxID=1907941 RepID=A0A1S8CQQ1_9GAMM|nr:hypothetical protein BKE30_15070 [Alkanindiges hydrocarboniclasticus]